MYSTQRRRREYNVLDAEYNDIQPDIQILNLNTNYSSKIKIKVRYDFYNTLKQVIFTDSDKNIFIINKSQGPGILNVFTFYCHPIYKNGKKWGYIQFSKVYNRVKVFQMNTHSPHVKLELLECVNNYAYNKNSYKNSYKTIMLKTGEIHPYGQLIAGQSPEPPLRKLIRDPYYRDTMCIFELKDQIKAHSHVNTFQRNKSNILDLYYNQPLGELSAACAYFIQCF